MEFPTMRQSDLSNLINAGVHVFGDLTFRGKCPFESAEQMTFFNWIRRDYPDSWGALAFHPRNEGLKSKGQFSAVQRHAAEGMTPGVPDIIIPARMAFVCEMKRRDHTQSAFEPDQVQYLLAAHAAGAFACVALGVDAAREAFSEWLTVL
jgi:hypothetical protein